MTARPDQQSPPQPAPAGPDGAAPAIEVVALRKAYGSTVAVRDVSFAVGPGEIFGVLGPNGAGKTTTVECLAGLRSADAGTVRILGRDPQKDPASVRELLGVQLQEAELNERMTVLEALRLYASFYADPADVGELLDLLDLAPHRDQQFGKLSGGQKQRLSIALALVGNPRVAILDELTTGLDPQARRATWELVERVRDRGVTILLVTHFMDEAERLCDRLVIIDQGVVVTAGSPAELIESVDSSRVLRLRVEPHEEEDVLGILDGLADVQSVARTGREIEVTGTRRVLPAVVLALAEQDVVPDVRTMTRSLEDVFVHVTGRTYDHTGAQAPGDGGDGPGARAADRTRARTARSAADRAETEGAVR